VRGRMDVQQDVDLKPFGCRLMGRGCGERVLTVSTQTGIPALGPSGQHRVRPSHAHTPYFAQIEGHLLITTDYS
jgi:hypothetical protein